MAKSQKLIQRLEILEAITPAEPLQIQVIWQDKAKDGTITEQPGPLYVYHRPGEPPEKIQPTEKRANI